MERMGIFMTMTIKLKSDLRGIEMVVNLFMRHCWSHVKIRP